jgi:hydrogenase maturation protein HypF
MKHCLIELRGKVQGVGFRPFVYQLAQKLGLKGEAKNSLQGLSIEIVGEDFQVDSFLEALTQQAPKHAKISDIDTKYCNENKAEFTTFTIIKSTKQDTAINNTTSPFIAADRSLCSQCLNELFTASNHRFLHPFISCLDCGPRASIVRSLPYEREHTSYADFQACAICTNESTHIIEGQAHRFHSQTNSCWECGPRLSLHQQTTNKNFQAIQSHSDHNADYFELLAEAIHAGKVIAIKGISGFHLICDARQAVAVEALRKFKQRPDKPLAVMALNSSSIEPVVEINQQGILLLESESAPIVLFPKLSSDTQFVESLAPKVSDLGCMLPYTPIHYLLFHALLGKPSGTNWLNQAQAPLLVVTSANHSGEPLINKHAESLEKLSSIASYILSHDRDISFACDDSVLQASNAISHQKLMLRRARGYAPEPIPLPFSGKPVLALGAHLKHTFCLTDGQQAFLSPHLGELNSLNQYQHFEDILNFYLEQHSIKPELLACDLHPDFYSSRFAEDYALKHNIPLIKVAHHQAHIASVLAEARLPENSRFLALALDGIGLGEIGLAESPPLWGGELFYGELIHKAASSELLLQHQAQLSSLSLPGGDKATQEIGRIACALVNQCPDNLPKHIDDKKFVSPSLQDFIQRNLSSFPQTSSLGRWFDAVCALLAIRQVVSYEGQAAMELEALALHYGELPQSEGLAEIDALGNLNLYPLLPRLLSDISTSEACARFHSEIIDGLLRWLLWHSKDHQTKYILCSGGCFQNRIIRNALLDAAKKKGLSIHIPQDIPVNDAGISLGQAIIASLH